MSAVVKKPFIALSALILVLLLTASFVTKNAPQATKKVKVVCIDAGHGGKDPGCHGDVAKEKDVALAVALKLGAYITSHYPEIKVVYTRTTDVFVELNERAAIANRNNADLFICIHCNSACVRKKGTNGKYHDVCNEEACGSETYVMGLHKIEGNLEVAKRENDAVMFEDNYEQKYDLNINSDEAEIIYSTYQNLYLEQSSRFAQLCQEQFATRAGRDDKGVKQAGFLVLWKTSMPSVLIETGFLSSPAEERFLSSDKGQTHMAASIFRAFRTWKDELEGTPQKYDDDIERMAPYKVASADTAGLRKPVNYVNPKTGFKTPVKTETVTGKKPVKDSTAVIVQKPQPVKVDSVPPSPPPVATYRVQIISSDKEIANGSSQFKGVSDIWHYQQKGIYKYTAGSYSNQADAVKRMNELKKLGFNEAFVVAFDNKGNRITLDEARKMNGK
jgi:N-acetylmuramoyl-L-alanine amidase